MEWNNNHESKQKERKKTQNREEQSDVLHLLQDVVEDEVEDEVMSAPQPSVPKLFAWLHVSVDSDLLPQVGYFVR